MQHVNAPSRMRIDNDSNYELLDISLLLIQLCLTKVNGPQGASFSSNNDLRDFLLILPIAFLGISSKTMIREGTLYLAILCSAQHLRFSIFKSFSPPFKRHTMPTRSPQVSSGTPRTAHSAINGCSNKSLSISSAESLCLDKMNHT